MTEPHAEARPADTQAPAGPDAALTGNAEVDAAVRAVTDLERRPVAEHVAAFETAHRGLRTALAGGPGTAVPGD